MSATPRRRRRRPAAAPLTTALVLALLPGALLVAPARPLAAQPAAAQGTGRVAGTVLGEGGRPVSGAQVIVVGTRVGAVTDDNGRYNIGGVPAGAQTIRVQRIGFTPRTQPVTVAAGQVATLDVQLTAAATQLTTVAVVGYTNEARRDISGAVTSVGGAELRDQKVATIEEALRGRAPGVQIAASGQPGRPAQIIIRGQNGFNSPNPLYVVDGNYIGQQNPNLNPDDIASIEILKDASAAAQYGAQASNGVVVITTRRGQSGPTQFSFNSYYGFQQVPKRLNLASTGQLQGLFQQAYANANTPRGDQALVVRAPDSVATLANTNWQDAVFRTGAIQNYNLQASGGSTSANYLISGSVFNQDGTVLNTTFRRYSVRVNSEARRGRVTVGEAIALSQAQQADFGNGIFGGQALPLIDVASLPSAIPVRNANNPGGYGFGSDAIPAFQVNPVAVLERNSNRRRSNQVIGTGYGEVRLFGGLRYRANLGLNYADSLATVFTSATQVRYRTQILPVAPGLPGNNLFQATPTATNLLWENLLNYDGNFAGGLHRVSAVAGQTSQRNQYNQQTAFRQGFITDQQQLNAGSNVGFSNTGFTIPFRTNSLLARATYAYRDRYLATASTRRDCSSRFSPGNRCGTFGAGSLGWVVSEEPFFRNIPGLGRADFVKLRGSLGVLGDQNIGDLRYFSPVTLNINYANTGPGGTTLVYGGATPTQLANPNLRWQRNRSADVGLDLGLLGNTLTVTADYYSNLADQVLVDLPLPALLGSAANPAFNAGKVKNAGVEIGAQHRYERGAFRFNTALNLTTTANRVVSLGTGQPIRAGFNQVARTIVGEPIGAFWVRRTAGIFQSAADVQSWKNANGQVIQPNAQPGDLKFVDLNNDGAINDADRTTVGSPIPKLITGLFLDSRYRAVDVGLNLRGNFGGKIFNVVRYQTSTAGDFRNLRGDLNPSTPTRLTADPRLVFGQTGAGTNGDPASDRWVENGNFMRVQNLILGYTLPEGTAQRLRLVGTNRPRVYVNVQNLATFTRYSGYDPEILGFGNPLARGIDDGLIYPNPRTVSFGFDLRF